MPSVLIAAPPPQDADAVRPGVDPGAVVAARVRETVSIASALSPRATQAAIGPSELGAACDRRMGYRVTGTAPTGHADAEPWPAVVGTGVHAALAELFTRAAGRSGRYLIEHRVTYRGVSGSVDLFDRHHRMVIDWKSTTRSRLRRYARDGAPARHLVQVQTYAAGLIAAGESVDLVAVVYLPVDGTVADIHADVHPFDRTVADAAIDRHDRIASTTTDPAALPARPTALCRWCPWYRPGRAADADGCPGTTHH